MWRKSSNIIWHAIGCLTFLVIPIILSPRPPHMPLFSRPTLRDFLANGLMLIIFYLNYYLFIPKFYFRNKHVWYGLFVLIGFFAITLLPSILSGYIPWDPPRPGSDLFSRDSTGPAMRNDTSFLTQVTHNIFLYIAVVLFSVLLRIRMKLFDTEVLKHNAEIGSLKNQINPHFLFNTLNSIYAFALREKAPTTASSILRLSGMMRYVVTETGLEFVPLEKEITYTNDYIDLQKMRLTNTVNLSYSVIGNIAGQKIAPLILIPFIENAFKHGVNPDEESYISIKVAIANSSLELVVENKKVKTSHELHTKSGVGIENTKARLELLYPNKYFLSINDSTDHYNVKLNMKLM
jgi:sensor histidine kinase YesM